MWRRTRELVEQLDRSAEVLEHNIKLLRETQPKNPLAQRVLEVAASKLNQIISRRQLLAR